MSAPLSHCRHAELTRDPAPSRLRLSSRLRNESRITSALTTQERGNVRSEESNIQARLADGDPLGVFWFGLGNVAMIEAAVEVGAEGVVIDVQHGLFDRASLASPPSQDRRSSLSRARRRRYADGDRRALDAGAEGVIVPLVESCRRRRRRPRPQATIRRRAFAPAAAFRPLWRDDYMANAADDDHGRRHDRDAEKHPPMLKHHRHGEERHRLHRRRRSGLSLGWRPAASRINAPARANLKACRKAGKPCGLFTFGGAAAATKIAEGYALTVVHNDVSAVRDAFADAAREFREARAQPTAGR